VSKLNLKKPYYELYKKISDFKVWLVDGEYIRNNIDIEFTNYARCSGWSGYKKSKSFNYIPKNEFWIDKYRIPGEEEYYIQSMLLMTQLLGKGINRKKAIKIADKKEIDLRKKNKTDQKYFKLKKDKVIDNIHRNIIKRYSNNIVKVWLVNGRAVRDVFFTDFTHGGNDTVYKFIPKCEIWIDDNVKPSERKFVILHELYERNLMCEKNICYDDAHLLASKLELKYRHNPQGIAKKIRTEIHKHMRLK